MSDMSVGPKIISAQLVSQDEVKEARKKEVESAKTDGVNNVVLVDDTGDGDAIITNVAVEDISKFQVGTQAEIGTAKGKVVFIDDGFDDDRQAHAAQEDGATQAPAAADQTAETSAPPAKPYNMYNLSLDQAFKFVTVLEEAIKVYRNDDTKAKELARAKRLGDVVDQKFGSAEKLASVKSFQNTVKVNDDGDFGKGTFQAAMKRYQSYGRDPEGFTEKDFRALIDHAIEVFADPANKLDRFTDIWGLNY